jgi:uncharacterized protein YndB with AHSA1/START domain
MPRSKNIAEVRKHLAASPSRVFGAFADAPVVSRWLTPSPEVSLTILEFDFRVGGRYRFAYGVPSRGTMFVNGVYRTIEPLTTIVFSWHIEPPDEHAGLQSEVIITLSPRGPGTDLVIRHARLTQPGAAGRHETGWLGALEQLADAVRDAHWNASEAATFETRIE